MKNWDGPAGRAVKIQKTLTALIKHERIELFYNRADETRGYVDQLISEAIRRGPEDKSMMELADYWILEKQLVHKLFKVLVPRYRDYTTSYTRLLKAPFMYPGVHYTVAVLELRGNIYPSLDQRYPHEGSLLHNVLLEEARREVRLQKYKDIAAEMAHKTD